MTKAELNPETNTVDIPIHPCYRAPEKGLCRLRQYREDEGVGFECSLKPESCYYLKRVKEQQGRLRA